MDVVLGYFDRAHSDKPLAELEQAAALVADPYPHTAEWSRRAESGMPGTGQDPERIQKQIALFHEDVEAKNAHPMWGYWSEFPVELKTGERVSVVSKPDWDGEPGRHHIEFWHPKVSETGYWSIVTKKVPRMLVDWCREHIQKQADSFATRKPAVKPKSKKPAKAG